MTVDSFDHLQHRKMNRKQCGDTWRNLSCVIIVACVAMLLGTVAVDAVTPIRLVTYGAEEAFERWERIAAAFHADRPDYELDVEISTFSEYPTKVSLMVAAGAPPDVFMTWAQYKALWAETGLVMDLTPLWERSEIAQNSDVFSFMMDSAMYDGKIIGVPYDFSSMAITVNVDAMNEAGLALPDNDWTIDDYREYAIRLSKPDQRIYGSNSGALSTIANWNWAVNFTGDGWLSEDRTEVLVDRSEYVDMLNYWTDLINLGAAGTAPALNQWNGGYAMWQGWVHWGERLGHMASYDWAMLPMPKGPGGDVTFAHGHMWSLPFNAADPERGWVFLEWLLSPEGQNAIVNVDVRQPLSNDPGMWDQFFSVVQEDKQAMMRQLVIGTLYGKDRIHTMQYWSKWPDAERVMQQYLPRVFQGQDSASNLMSQAAQVIRVLQSEDD